MQQVYFVNASPNPFWMHLGATTVADTGGGEGGMRPCSPSR